MCHLLFLFLSAKKKIDYYCLFFFFFFFFRLPFSSSACLVVRSTRLREKTEQHATKGVVFLFLGREKEDGVDEEDVEAHEALPEASLVVGAVEPPPAQEDFEPSVEEGERRRGGG